MANYNIFKKALNLTEKDIRFAMAHTQSNRAAARFVGCDYNTYKKYACRYIDSNSNLTLFELHSNQSGKGMKRRGKGTKIENTSAIELLEGKHPSFPAKEVKAKILQSGIFEERCDHCGFEERRITDGCVPLVLIWKDGDFTNHHADNLELACYNCYFLTYNDVFQKSETIDKKCEGYYE